MANYAADVAAVVHAIPNRKVVLVGHAMGGIVALEAARRIGAVSLASSRGLPENDRSAAHAEGAV
jgi:pimeloyl-ACP methyl ester carboxylesterase